MNGTNLAGLLFLSGLFLFVQIVDASLFSSGDITFSVDQKDYYFKTGEDAIIPLHIENTYGKRIDGILTYYYTHKINQGGMYISSSNSQSISFSVKNGGSEQRLNFGTSDSPSILDIGLKFSYTENGSRVVNLDGIRIHFVSNESQKQNRPNRQSASSEKYTAAASQQQNPFSQMQKQLNQIMNNYQQSQNPQRTLQNSQIAQDSSALKQQIEKRIKESEIMKSEFREKLAQNREFQKEHQKLLNQGYNLTDANFDVISNDTGTFELKYRNPDGELASLSGKMDNGKLENLRKDTPETRRELLNKLQQNERFQEYQRLLQKRGYSKQNTEILQQQNKTTVNVNYANQNNETAIITAKVVNNTIQNVELQKMKTQKQNYWWILVLLFAMASGYFAYKKLSKKTETSGTDIKRVEEKLFDYKSESIELIERAKKLFEQKRHKDAYGMVGQALRLFLSYENKLNKETTNDEIISFLRGHKKEYKEAKECFDLCSLVEFAKHEANEKDFYKIMRKAKKIINRK